MNVCEPVFERWFIHDTFACRVGKGREGAIRQARRYAHRSEAYLKMDIRKYFDSIDHRVLIAKLSRVFKEPKLITLFVQIIDSFRGGIGQGLPIGSLTSQHFANFFLGHFDRFVKETLHQSCYLRYMDDMLIFNTSTSDLVRTRDACVAFLKDELKLQCKGQPYINRIRHGVDFLGFRIFPSHIALNRRSRVRFRRRLVGLEKDYMLGYIEMPELSRRAMALNAFATSSGVSSWQFRQRVLQQFSGGWSQGLEPGEPRRRLEQLAGELPFSEPQQEHA
jgi:hypothetical protein